MKIFKLFEEDNPYKCERALELLGLDIKENQRYILNEISKYLFNPQNGGKTLKERNFDLNYDYKYYYVDFRRLDINLNKQDIDWWEFDSLLEGFMLDDNSTISKVLYYRTYTKPSKSIKTQEEQRHRFMLKMKDKYSLPIIQNTNAFEKMWGYLEKKVGDK